MRQWIAWRGWVCGVGLCLAAACSFDASGLAPPFGDDDARAPDGGDAGADGAPPQRPDAAAPPAVAAVWVTTPDRTRLLVRDPDIPFGAIDGALTRILSVDPARTYQTVRGFGASLTDSAAWVIDDKLEGNRRAALLRQLFDRDDGIGLSLLRQPMGASDFARRVYSYDDTPSDLADFSIRHDQGYITPLLREIRALNPSLTIIATPWSPPGWMKTTSSMIRGRLKPTSYRALADYFVRFLQAYADDGVPVAAITMQNEPHYEPAGYPGMFMEWTEQATFLDQFLAPALHTAGLDTEIYVWDADWDEPDYPLQILADPLAKAAVAGTAFHCYHGDPSTQQQVHDAHPDRAIWITECSSGLWRGDFAAVLRYDVQTLIIGGLRNWASAVITWNLALDPRHGPNTGGGCADCLGTVEISDNGEVTPNAEYYALGHASKFVVPGAVRIESTTLGAGSLESVAFANPDGSVAVVVLNSGTAAADFQLAVGDRGLAYQLPAGAVATFAWGGRFTR